jgi:hypothetical protein
MAEADLAAEFAREFHGADGGSGAMVSRHRVDERGRVTLGGAIEEQGKALAELADAIDELDNRTAPARYSRPDVEEPATDGRAHLKSLEVSEHSALVQALSDNTARIYRLKQHVRGLLDQLEV